MKKKLKLLNLGSLNCDRVYHVSHFCKSGETISAEGFRIQPGGKGLNQSVAARRAGAEVYHCGAIGYDGDILLKELINSSVNTDLIDRKNMPSGHAIIQVSGDQNCIIVCGGANYEVKEEDIDRALKDFHEEDILLTQNETSCVAYAMQKAKEKGMKIAFNASPIREEVFQYPLTLVDYLFVNEIEACDLAGVTGESSFENALTELAQKFPDTAIILTAGRNGAYCRSRDNCMFVPAIPVEVRDTTAAGDTFCGFFLGSILRGLDTGMAMRQAATAAGLAVSRAGAAESIPELNEVEQYLGGR